MTNIQSNFKIKLSIFVVLLLLVSLAATSYTVNQVETDYDFRSSAANPNEKLLSPVADAFVNHGNPNNNSGTSGDLRVKKDPTKFSYLKFDLNQLAGLNINSAKLRLWITDPSTDIINIRPVSDDSWTERGITYNNRPLFGNVLTSFSANINRAYKDIDLTDYTRFKTGGLMSLAIQTFGTNELQFKSRNFSDLTKRPVLIVQTADLSLSPTPVGDNTPPTITNSRVEGLVQAPEGSRYPYTVPLDEALDPIIEGYDSSDDVSAEIILALPDRTIQKTNVNVSLPEFPEAVCSSVRCFHLWGDNFTTTQTGYHKLTIRVADSRGAEAPPQVFEFIVDSDPPTTLYPTRAPAFCTTDNNCPSHQTCDTTRRFCLNLTCPVPSQCKVYSFNNHSCTLENGPDGAVCTASGLQGTCQSGACSID